MTGRDALPSDAMHRWDVVRWLALLALCAAYLQGGLTKAFAFEGAVAEMQHFGILPAAPFAVATILVELGASLLILTGIYRVARRKGTRGVYADRDVHRKPFLGGRPAGEIHDDERILPAHWPHRRVCPRRLARSHDTPCIVLDATLKSRGRCIPSPSGHRRSAVYFGERLSPGRRLGEILCGLIMTLTFTLGASLLRSESEMASNTLMYATIGCNVAWAIIDSALLFVARMFERSRRARIGDTIRRERERRCAADRRSRARRAAGNAGRRVCTSSAVPRDRATRAFAAGRSSAPHARGWVRRSSVTPDPLGHSAAFAAFSISAATSWT